MIFLDSEIERSVACTSRYRGMLKPSLMIAGDTIVQAAIQASRRSCTENKNNFNLFTRPIIINGRGGAGKSYIIDTILTTLVTEHGWYKDCHLNLVKIGKADYLIR